jgi:hypothetical protein
VGHREGGGLPLPKVLVGIEEPKEMGFNAEKNLKQMNHELRNVKRFDNLRANHI